MNHPPRFLSLEPKPRCPNRRCERFVYELDPEQFLGALKCPKCGAHWWAFKLQAGDVRAQLLRDFDGDTAIVDRMMALYHVPATISSPAFWQIWLSGNEFYRFVKDESTGIRGRTMGLFRRLVNMFPRAA